MPKLSLATWARLALLTQRLRLSRLSYLCAERAGFVRNYYEDPEGRYV